MGSIIHTLDLLEILACMREPVALADLARKTRRPKSTLHRQLRILVQAGFVTIDPDGLRYSLSIKLWSLGISVFAHLDAVAIARPHLEWLMKETDEAAHLVILEGNSTAVYVARVESRQPVGAKYQVGDRIPALISSSGRAILAFLDDRDLKQHFSRRLDPNPRRDAVEKRCVKAALTKIRTLGYSVAQGGVFRERGGIAAPVRNHTGQVVASCGIAVPTFRMTPALIDRSLAKVVAAAERISHDLGYVTSPTARR